MKNSIKKITGAMVIAFAISVAPLHATNDAKVLGSELVDMIKNDLVGGWEYSVEGAPEGYDSGFLVIVQEGDNYKVQVVISGGAMQGSDVVVKGNDITFKLMVEGDSVSVSLSAKGSAISGTSTSSNGTYNITGVKTISE